MACMESFEGCIGASFEMLECFCSHRILEAAKECSFEDNRSKIEAVWSRCQQDLERKIDEHARYHLQEQPHTVSAIRKASKISSLHSSVLLAVDFVRSFALQMLVLKVAPDQQMQQLSPQSGFQLASPVAAVGVYVNFFSKLSSARTPQSIESFSYVLEFFRDIPSLPTEDFTHLRVMVSYVVNSVFEIQNLSVEQISHTRAVREETLLSVLSRFAKVYTKLLENSRVSQALVSLQARLMKKIAELYELRDRLDAQCDSLHPENLREVYRTRVKLSELEMVLPGAFVIADVLARGILSLKTVTKLIHMSSLEKNVATIIPELESYSLKLKEDGATDLHRRHVERVLVNQHNCLGISQFLSLPDGIAQKMSSLFSRWSSNFNLHSLYQYLENGGSFDVFCELHKKNRFSCCLPKILLTREWVLFFESLSPERLELARKHGVVWMAAEKALSLPLFQRIIADAEYYKLFSQIREVSLWGASFEKVFLVLIGEGLFGEKIKPFEFENVATFLSHDQKLRLIENMSSEALPLRALYVLENEGRLEDHISNKPLTDVPPEVLIRFLSSWPMEKALGWLQECITISEGLVVQKRLRIDTLTADQKRAILGRFRSFDGRVQPEWMKVFRVPDEEALNCHRVLIPTSEETDELHLQLQQQIDPRDPTSLFLQVLTIILPEEFPQGVEETFDVYRRMVIYLLLCAKESSVCGSRHFLRWGNASEVSGLCCAQDGTSLVARDGEACIALYPRGVFGDFSFAVPAFTLRRILVEQCKYTVKTEFMNQLLDPSNPLTHEIDRIALHLQERFPTLVSICRRQRIGEDVSDGVSDDDATFYVSSTTGESSEFGSSSSELEEEDLFSQIIEPSLERSAAAVPHEPAESVPVVRIEPQRDVGYEGDSEEEVPSPFFRPPLIELLDSPGESMAQEIAVLEVSTTLSQKIQKHFASFQTTAEWSSSATLCDLIRYLYRHFTREDSFSHLYDGQSRSDNAAYCLLCVLLLSRMSKVEDMTSRITVFLSPLTQYRISTLNLASYRELPEDNSWLPEDRFHEYCADYAPFTLSPVTPNRNIPPICFVSLVREIQQLSDSEFYELCERTLLAVRKMEPSMATEYIQEHAHQWTEKNLLSVTAQMSLGDLLEHYMSFVSDFIQPIFPDGKYYFNPRGAGQFEPIERVPQFLRAEGNFASAICHFFTPIEPISHDGNCCVEAILIAHRGYIAYQKTDDGFFLLKKEIREFRDAVVRYAKKYEKELSTEFSQKDVSTLIQGYSTADQDLWTDDLALICASRCLQRPIIVYGRSGVVFTTDASGQLTPARMFSMEDVTRGAPIQLMFWDNAHYCLLNRREESQL